MTILSWTIMTSCTVPARSEPRKVPEPDLTFTENFLEQRRDLRGGIGADLHLLLAEHVEQTVQGLSDNVIRNVEILAASERQRLYASRRELLVLLYDTGLIHRRFHRGFESNREGAGSLSLKVLRG